MKDNRHQSGSICRAAAGWIDGHAVPASPSAPAIAVNRHSLQLLRGLAAWLPAPLRVDARERSRAVLGSTLGILLTGVLSRWVASRFGIDPWLAAPLGASAVLVFAVPSSPLAQPWSVIGGNTVSALVGLVCATAIGDPAMAGSVAVGSAIAVMFVLRCLHPPGGATALLAVLTHTADPRFALLPILLNSALLVSAGTLFNSLTGRRYPHTQQPPQPVAGAGSRFTAGDLDAALAHYNQVLDVSRDDLEELLHLAEAAAYRRNLGELRCRDIMSSPAVSVSRNLPLEQAWTLMRSRRIKALPVVDGAGHIVGIATLADFVRHMLASDTREPDGRVTIGQVMTRRVRVAGIDQHVIELLPLFSEGGHHHLPVVDAAHALVGMITQSDLVRALHRAVQPG